MSYKKGTKEKALIERKHRMDYLIECGYTTDLETGYVYNPNGKRVGFSTNGAGYHSIQTPLRNWVLLHHFIYYVGYNSVEEIIDHLNRNKTDNRLCNLVPKTHQENMWNNDSAGYYYDKSKNRWCVRTAFNRKTIFICGVSLESEAKVISGCVKEMRKNFMITADMSNYQIRSIVKKEMGLI